MATEQEDVLGGSSALAILHVMTSYTVAQSIYVAAKLGIADVLAAGPHTCDDLARATGTHPRSLARLMRALISIGIFTQDEDQQYRLTPLASHLQSTGPGAVHAAVLMYGAEIYQAWGALLHSVQAGEPAFGRVFGIDWYDYLATHPEAGATFNAWMTETARDELPAVVAAYDFSGIHTLVDVGGGQGQVLVTILAANPTLRGILIDQPFVVDDAPGLLAAAGVADRCAVVGGDIFAAVPRGGDAYLIARTLLNWSDDRARALLNNCRAAMTGQGKLLVIDPVLPATPSPEAYNDLHLLVMGGGRMCTAAEFRALLASAGFTLTRILPTASRYSIIEAVRAEDDHG